MQRPDFQPTQPAPLSSLSGKAIDNFRVGHPAELVSLLRQLADRNVLVQVSAPGGAAYTTVVWTVDPANRRLSLDADPSHPQIRALVDAGEATAVAYLDSVKLQFDLHGLVLVHGTNASALQAALPDVLYRFQRREYFRVRTHEGATAHFQHPSSPKLALSLRVLDVSVGGCALALPAEVPPIAAGSTIAPVELEFDAEARFAVALQVQHVSGGFHPQARGLRLGCSFERLDGLAERSLQRFIDVTQRKAKLLSFG